jgi:MOSC domain-containing protein YiiM
MARVLQINVKAAAPDPVGLPKRPIPAARIDARGVAGDFNHYRHDTLHDEADSAVLLMPRETIDALDREGWPVRPGDLGENLTTEGLPYDSMGPGRRLAVGEAVLEVTRACDPCTNLYALPYVGKEKGPAFVKTMVGRRGWYARVVRAGTVRVGDPIAPLEDPA